MLWVGLLDSFDLIELVLSPSKLNMGARLRNRSALFMLYWAVAKSRASSLDPLGFIEDFRDPIELNFGDSIDSRKILSLLTLRQSKMLLLSIS